jgi:hypothetical protein
MSRLSRRRLLAEAFKAAAGVTGLEFLESVNSVAFAQGVRPRKFVYLTTPGAPNRWQFDLFLDPDKSAQFLKPPHLGTILKADANGKYATPEWRLEKVGNTWVPPLWIHDLPKNGGGTWRASQLLQNMVHIRGVDLENDGHQACQRLHQRPLGARTTMTAAPGDNSNAPFPAIALGFPGYDYESRADKSPVVLGAGGNIIANLMRPVSLRNEAAGVEALAAKAAPEANALDKALTNASVREYKDASTVVTAHGAASQLLRRQFPDFQTVWTALLTKYEDLLKRVLTTNFPGISDKPVGMAAASRGDHYQYGQDKILSDADLRTMFKTAKFESMAAVFAASEFVLQYNLSDSIALNLGTIGGLVNSAGATRHVVDEHFNGAVVSILVDHYMYAGVATCLLELVSRLKSLGMWGETVLEVTGEFNRAPQADGAGSDHGSKATSVAVYSGAVTNGPHIFGDLVRQSPVTAYRDRYPGTWGIGATFENNKPLSIGHVAASMAVLLRVPSPITAFSSLWTIAPDGSLKPRIGRGKTVA